MCRSLMAFSYVVVPKESCWHCRTSGPNRQGLRNGLALRTDRPAPSRDEQTSCHPRKLCETAGVDGEDGPGGPPPRYPDGTHGTISRVFLAAHCKNGSHAVSGYITFTHSTPSDYISPPRRGYRRHLAAMIGTVWLSESACSGLWQGVGFSRIQEQLQG